MAHIQDRGKQHERRWQARYRDPAGRERTKTFRRKLDAQRFLDEVTTSMVTGQYVAPDAGKVTFREYAEDWRAAQVHRASTAETVERHLRRHAYPAFGDRPIGSILPSHVQAWVKGLSVDLAPATVAVTHGIVASVFRSAIRDRRITASPCEGTKLPEAHREPVVPLETGQVRALEAAMSPRFRALVTLGAATGLRISEALGLTVDRSGLRPLSVRPTLTVDRQLVAVSKRAPYLGPPKRRASRREIPLPRVAVDALAAHLAGYPPVAQELEVVDGAGRTSVEPVELVFTTERGGPIRRSRFADPWRAAVAAAEGVPDGTTYHDLRHYYASLLIRHGESVKVVQSRLGHATAAETLDTYSHLWPDSEDRTRAAVDSVLGAPAESARNGEVAE
jgi:integrase